MTARRSPLFPIFLIVLVDVFGLTLVIPLLAIYAEHFGATPFQATLLVSTYAVCQLVSGPILGSFSDHYGRKPVLLVSQMGTCLGFLLMARADALWIIFVSRIIDGATAGNLTTAQAYISDNTAPENRSKSFALIGIAFGVGFFIGPSVTGLLATYSLNAPIYLAAGLSLTSILCTTFLLPGGSPPRAHEGESAGPGGPPRVAVRHRARTRSTSRVPFWAGSSRSSFSSSSPSPPSPRASPSLPSAASRGRGTPSARGRSATCSPTPASSESSFRGGSWGAS